MRELDSGVLEKRVRPRIRRGARMPLLQQADERQPAECHSACTWNIPRQHQEWLHFQGEACRVRRVLVEIGLKIEWLRFREVRTLAARTVWF